MPNDLISDMLTRIRNSHKVNKLAVIVPKTKTTQKITKILQREGFINSFTQFSNSLHIKLKYKVINGQSVPAISCLKRISKPGLRVYSSYNTIPKVLGGLGVVLISTSEGILTDRQARKRRLGGEILCCVW